jgi:hypothetical protein
MSRTHPVTARKKHVAVHSRIRRRRVSEPIDTAANITSEHEIPHLRRKLSSLESVFGSIPALPNESPDLEREIDEATAWAFTSRTTRR